jgi:NitT/TauT family transport system substrate-binding protein
MLSEFEKDVADKKIDLSRTYTNSFTIKANQKYK